MTSDEPAAGAPAWRALPLAEVGRWRWHVPTATLDRDDACGRIHGAQPGEAPAQTWQRVVHPSDVARMTDSEVWSRAQVHTYRVRDGAGAPRYLMARLTHVEGATGSGPTGGWVRGMTVDVTDSHEAATSSSSP